MKRAGAFTLLELLVVIIIIALVACLVLPAFSRIRANARTACCLNNLRQWGMAVQLYAADHQLSLPPEGFANPQDRHTNSGWYIQLPAQLGLPRYHDMPWRTNAALPPGRSLWICPANPRRSNGANLFHYCLNGYLDGSGAEDHPIKLFSVPDPAKAVYLFDSKNLPAVAAGSSRPWNFVHTNLHERGAQFVFLDAHAARFSRPEYWDFPSNRGRTNNPALVWIPR